MTPREIERAVRAAIAPEVDRLVKGIVTALLRMRAPARPRVKPRVLVADLETQERARKALERAGVEA